MKNFERPAKNTVLIFCVAGKKECHFGINAKVLDSMFLNTSWLYSVEAIREEFETESLRIIFIDVQNKNNMGLK